jgi:Ca2+-binding RTX toxin-like protein
VRRDPTRLFTIDDALGAGDEIYGGAGADQIFGGVAGDTIYAGAGSDVVLGDAGRIDRLPAPDAPPMPVFGDVVFTLFDRIRTLQPDLGAGDDISGEAGNDLILGGAGGDMISGGENDDLVLGDFGRISFTQGVLNQVAVTDLALGGPDTIFGNAGDDLLMGGALGDAMDGNAGADLIFGDAVLLSWRGADVTNPRFQTLLGSQIYNTAAADASGVDQVDGIARNYRNPGGGVLSWAPWQVLNLYHTAALEAAPDDSFGNDYLAGGPDHDMLFGQLGDDTIQGDGSILFVSAGNYADIGSKVGAVRDDSNFLLLNPSFEAATDGDDYIEGNGGADVVFGGLGQDDILGGSSDLFTLDAPEKRPDGADLLFGGAGLRAGRNAEVSGSDSFFAERHARDADMILGDNGNIYRLVGAAGVDGGGFLTFNYDVMGLAADGYSASRRIIPRAARLLDYTPGGPDFDAAGAAQDLGAADEIHGESGDDLIWHERG